MKKNRFFVIHDTTLSPSAKQLAMVLFSLMARTGTACVSQRRLAGLSGLALSTVKEALSKIIKQARDAHGLLTATLAEFYPDLMLRTTLPQKQRTDIIIPSNSDVLAIMKAERLSFQCYWLCGLFCV